jgi:acyl-CoA synthetase (AMP-forming)/AMP-acid ligase II
LRERAIESAERAGLSAAVIVVIDDGGETLDGDRDAGDLPGVHAKGAEIAFDPATHLAVLPYSSGTTGHPKGVMLTHRNLVANVAQLAQFGLRRDDSVVAVLPFFHIYGMTALLNATLHGRAQLVVMPSFDLAAFLGCIAKHRCTIAFIAPPIALALAKHPIVDDYDLSSLRALLSGAAPLDEALGRPVSRRIGCRVMQGYGMSELSPVSHGIPFDGGAELLGAGACRARVRTSAPAS